jgi:hypothetical protein
MDTREKNEDDKKRAIRDCRSSHGSFSVQLQPNPYRKFGRWLHGSGRCIDPQLSIKEYHDEMPRGSTPCCGGRCLHDQGAQQHGNGGSLSECRKLHRITERGALGSRTALCTDSAGIDTVRSRSNVVDSVILSREAEADSVGGIWTKVRTYGRHRAFSENHSIDSQLFHDDGNNSRPQHSSKNETRCVHAAIVLWAANRTNAIT